MSNKKISQGYEDAIEIYINKFNLYVKEWKEYKYIGKDKDGLYLYDYIPNYNKQRNVFNILNEKHTLYISNSEYNTNVEEDILGLFKDGEIITISEGIEKIKTLINSPVDKLFKLLSEVQGVEIKPYDRFEIKTADNVTLGPYYLDKNFRRYYSSGIREYAEDSFREILTGEMKVLKCKKSIVLTEDDIICLKYYLKNGYKYIANETTEDLEGKQQRLKLFKEKPIYNKRNVTYKDVWEHYINKINTTKDTDWTIVKDELSFEHYYYPEIWDIEELLEQERVSND